MKEHFCEINLPRALAAPKISGGNRLCNCGKGHHEVHFCEIILNLDKWFRSRCCFKDFLSRALAANLFDGAKPFLQF